MKKKIYVVSSSHWDREWYETFEQYRSRLVRLIDELLYITENIQEYRCFHFDGQTILIEDYLRIRPENRERLYKAIRAGKILIGPWYVMPDEFLISGEALVRNLNRGEKICRDLGVESNKSGYICDIFGHNSQLPQIFEGFGIDNASLFRGRAGYEKDNFLWKGADGTRTIVHKLHPDYAYSSFFFVARWPFEHKGFNDDNELVLRVKKYLEEESANFATDCHLMVDGVDHIDPERELPKILKTLNDNIEGYEFIHSNFEDYTARIRENITKLEVSEGVLYDVAKEGINNSLLKNVLSSNVHLKQANDYCESNLTLSLEPLSFFVENGDGDKYGRKLPYGGFIEEAWDNVLKNQPHDSICGCSITATHEDNVNRYKHAKEIIGVVEKDALEYFKENVTVKDRRDGAFILFNNTPEDVDGIREVYFDIPSGTHQWSFKFYDHDGNFIPHNIIDMQSYNKKQGDFKKLIVFPRFDKFTLAMHVCIPAYSYAAYTYDNLKMERTNSTYGWKLDVFNPPKRNIGSMRTSAGVIDNGVLEIAVNPNGTLNIFDKQANKLYQNMLFFEDCADVGEGWNYVKPPFNSEINSLCGAASYRVLADCPEFIKFEIAADIKIPVKIDGNRRADEYVVTTVTSRISVAKNDKRIRITTCLDNKAVNHRLRAVFPTGINTDKFKTLIPFDLYEWEIKKADWSETKEVDTLVNPNQGAVKISGENGCFALYNKGLYEAAVLDRADRPVYLTLFRSFTNETSENEAVMGKMLGPVKCEYCLDFEKVSDSETVKRANAFKLCLLSTPVGDGKKLSGKHTFVRITGEGVLSALGGQMQIKDEKFHIVRLYDVAGGSEGSIVFDRKVQKAYEVNLKGDIIRPATIEKGAVAYRLKAKKIVTVAFKF